MIVIKFGGTSVGNAERIATAIDIVASARERRPIVVVSALSGVTNDLVAATERASSGASDEALTILDRVRVRHEEVGLQLVKQKSDYYDSFLAQLHKETDQIGAILRGIALVGDVSPRARDKIVAIGEKLSSVLFAYSVRLKTLPGVHVDSEEVIVTNDQFGGATPDMARTTAAAAKVLLPEIERGHIPVLGGFIGRSTSGATTTLGRGGSDYSAAILGAGVQAEEIQIWTDVDGMMTCDPRLIPSAKVIDRISYVEAAELAYFGAKVLHPKTIAPAVDREIPIRVLNTHNRTSEGTLITRNGESGRVGPRAVALKRGITIVHITSDQMLGAHGFLARIFEVFDDLAIEVDLVTTSEVSVSVTVEHHEQVSELAARLAPFARTEVLEGQAIIAIVGRGLVADSTLLARVFSQSLPITMLSMGTSGLNLSLVLSETDIEQSIRAIHHSIFEQDAGTPT
ncbi:MAG TPA: aspartate kinase [Thermoanaerobaculia bacterium]|nr:aspartate kinase [Thermoanaerobaculia bacterium]